MEDKIVSTRIDKKTYNLMKMYNEVNWSAVIRNTLKEKIKKTEKERVINKKKMRATAKIMDELAKSNTFNKGKSSTEIIREWRDKRKF